MEVLKRKIIMCLLMSIIVGYYKIEGRDPVLHRVGGGRYTWLPDVNFTKWASNEHFYKGDWLCKILQFSPFDIFIFAIFIY